MDLIKEHIKVASGLPLTLTQDDIRIKGHAIECRINAEDPNNFLPCPGLVSMYHAPGGPGIRMDSHLYSGYKVPPYYDSLIGKLIAYGETREMALRRMHNALHEIVVDGIKTNIPLHHKLVQDEQFKRGGVNIHYLEKKLKAEKEGL